MQAVHVAYLARSAFLPKSYQNHVCSEFALDKICGTLLPRLGKLLCPVPLLSHGFLFGIVLHFPIRVCRSILER
jgi:hypothetical protein